MDDGEVAVDESNIADADFAIKTSGGMIQEDGSHANNMINMNTSNTRAKKCKDKGGEGVFAGIQQELDSKAKEMDIEINFAISHFFIIFENKFQKEQQ